MAPNLYAKLIDGKLITTCAPEEDTDLIDRLALDGFKPYDDSAPKPEIDIPEPAASTLDLGMSKAVDPESAADNRVSGSVAKLSLSESVPAYKDDGDRIVLEWVILENSPAKVAAEIDRLRALLDNTDYRVTKSYEYALVAKEPPYDVAALHDERQALRDRINELEELLEES